jgi:hypothetical protein
MSIALVVCAARGRITLREAFTRTPTHVVMPGESIIGRRVDRGRPTRAAINWILSNEDHR